MSDDWTRDLEGFLQEFADAAGYESMIYRQMAQRARRANDRINVAAGVISGLVGVEGLVSLLSPPEALPFWLRAAVVVLSFASAVLLTLHGTWRLDEVREAATDVQARLQTVKRTTHLQLILPPHARQGASCFAQGVIAEYEAVKLAAPLLEESAIKSFERATGRRFVDYTTASVRVFGGGGSLRARLNTIIASPSGSPLGSAADSPADSAAAAGSAAALAAGPPAEEDVYHTPESPPLSPRRIQAILRSPQGSPQKSDC